VLRGLGGLLQATTHGELFMKKTALLAAAAALLAATPAFAQSGGYVGLTAGNSDDYDADVVQLDGAFGGASGSLGYQIDAGYANIDDSADTQSIAGHLYWNGGGWRLGAVAAHTVLNPDSADDVTETVYGAEGSWNLGANTVVVGSYTVGEVEFIFDIDTWNADIGLNHYFSDNLSVGASLGTGNYDGCVLGEFDANTYRINAEWQPWTTPVSFALGYNSFQADSGASFDSDTLSLGVRWNWGGSLRERDNATPFDTRTALFQRIYDLR
jgi:hypothetical protein